MPYSLYYQAKIKKELCWLFVAGLRSFEHLAFDRTIDVAESIFEFFVSPEMEETFLEVMHYFKAQHIVIWFCQAPNRCKV
ncbi:MAG: hypothetical protein WBQ73_00680 [Candidatus Babeliales bacterium]